MYNYNDIWVIYESEDYPHLDTGLFSVWQMSTALPPVICEELGDINGREVAKRPPHHHWRHPPESPLAQWPAKTADRVAKL